MNKKINPEKFEAVRIGELEARSTILSASELADLMVKLLKDEDVVSYLSLQLKKRQIKMELE